MTRQRFLKTNFTAGEVSPRLRGRGDLRAYESGALKLANVVIHATGGLSRRPGFYHVHAAAGDGRLIPFEFNTEQAYLLVLTELQAEVIANGESIATLATPWTLDQLGQLTWTQSADTLLLCHPDVPPRQITRTPTGWTLGEWVFWSGDGKVNQPYFKFAAFDVTLSGILREGGYTLTASSPVFDPDHVGTRLRFGEDEVTITGYGSPTVVDVTSSGPLTDLAARRDWAEQAFSPVRGWPISACFHQERLVIGGSKALPNQLWFSRAGDLWNFDIGEGEADEAIAFPILSDQVNAIRAVFSGRHLQVFTGGAEWMVTGNPLTPETVQLHRQTRIGSRLDRAVPPVDIDGATLFVARNGREIREFLYTDLEQAYRSSDLALLAGHIIDQPVDQAFDPVRRLLAVVMQDGTLATLTLYRAEQVIAWTRHATEGSVRAVAASGDDLFLLVKRGSSYFVETLDDTVNTDAGLSGSSLEAAATWSGLDHLNGRMVTVVADGARRADALVAGGQITIDPPARAVEVGLPYTHSIEPLPPSAIERRGEGRALRLIEAVFVVHETQALTVDVGRGLKEIPLRRFGDAGGLDTAPPLVSGAIRVPGYGWNADGFSAPWKIEQAAPLPFTLLSVTLEMKVND